MLNKKEFIRNRPFDEIDAMDMQHFIEKSIKDTVEFITGFGVVNGLNIEPNSGMSIKINTGLCFDSAGNKLEVVQEEILNVGSPSAQSKIAVITLKKLIISKDNIDSANKYDLGSNFIYSRDLLISYEPTVYVGNPNFTPVRPQVPSGEVELAEIRIRAGASSINVEDIKDTRSFVRKYYLDILDGPTSERPTNPKISQFYFDTTIRKMIVYNGSSWDVIETTAGSEGNLISHTSRNDNPHNVTKQQIGLSNVDNIQQATKAEFNIHNNDVTRHITSAERNSWNSRETTSGAQAKVDAHANNTSNPHNVNKSQVGLSNVDNIQQATKSEFNTHNNDNIRHISAQERTDWNNKETTSGSSSKANQAYNNAILYVDDEISGITQYIDSKTNFDDGIIIGDYKISVNQSGDLEITIIP